MKLLILTLLICTVFSISGCKTSDKTVPVKESAGIEILYLSNLNGVLENCHCGDPSLGGLDRIAAIVKKKRASEIQTIFVDGGDFFNTYPFPELNSKVAACYAALKPDILALGDQEFIEGRIFLERALQKMNLPAVVTSNLEFPGQPDAGLKIIERDEGPNLVFLSYLHESVFNKFEKDNIPDLASDKFDRLYEKAIGKGIVIVIFHGEQNDLEKFITRYPDIDLVLSAHTQRQGKLSSEKPMVVGGGLDGEFLMQIKISGKSERPAFSVRPIPIGLEIDPEKQINKIINDKDPASK